MGHEIYEVEGGWGFRILNADGSTILDQPFDPQLEGLQPYTEEGATAAAELFISSFVAAPTPEYTPPAKTAEQLRIEQLETQLADVQLALAELFTI